MVTHGPIRRIASAVAAASVLYSAAVIQTVQAAEGSLPLKRVVLFNSGVGFFEHRGEVEGTASVDLKFNVDDVNDLLKSMVLRDLGGGRVSTVTYGSMDPITKTLKTFAIDLTNNPTLADILGQIRGERVEIEAPTKIAGTIVGVEVRREQIDDKVYDKAYLNLLTDDGLRSLALESIARIKLANERLDAELRQALTVLAMGNSTDKKTVTLNFLGQGKRPVEVSYIQETPIWKTSYRLVLSEKDPPLLQGWAIVENTTEEDWKNVQLTLVSGRPISFVMNLYEPLYVPRPLVEPELFASLRPQTYEQDLVRKGAEFLARQQAEQLRLREADGLAANARRLAAAAAPYAALADKRGAEKAAAAGYAMDRAAEQQWGFAGVQAAARAGDVGELFQYVIDTPVDLVRQRSAMLPIVNEGVQGEKLSIYNAKVHEKHPLNGLRLTNSTSLHLMQGPITVFDGGAYAGDAQIMDLPPGSERLISYAMDLDTEVAAESKSRPQQLVSVRLVRGTCYTSHKYLRSQHYTVKNSGERTKTVLVEYPLDSSWKLLAPEKPAETTRNMYRFAVNAEPGIPARLDVEEEQLVSQTVAITNLDTGTIQLYLRAKEVSDSVKSALSEVVQRKAQIAEISTRKQQLDGEINTITQEQSRIRQNMERLDRNSDLYIRYVKKFGEQEDQIEQLRVQIAQLQEELNSREKALNDFLQGLNVS